jgi:hypothetical protein
MTCPVRYDDSSEQRNITALAISSPRPALRTGVMAAKCSRESVKRPSEIAFSSIGVTTVPGDERLGDRHAEA